MVKISIGADFRKNNNAFITVISTVGQAGLQKTGALMRTRHAPTPQKRVGTMARR